MKKKAAVKTPEVEDKEQKKESDKLVNGDPKPEWYDKNKEAKNDIEES